MKKIMLIMLLALSVLNGMGQISFLNDTKGIATFSADKSFSKKYTQLMEDLLESESNIKKKNKAVDKLLIFFKSYSSNNTLNIREVVNYQLGHYYAFGVFDPFYRDKPSNINREELKPLNKELALSYLDKVKALQGFLRLIPHTWLTDYEMGLGMASSECNLIIPEIADFISSLKNVDINFFNCGKYAMDYCDICFKQDVSYYWDYPSLDAVINLLSILYELPQNHPFKSQLLPSMSTDDIACLALSFQKAGKKYETLYYGALGAMRGDANCLIVMFDEFANSITNHFKIKHPAFERAGYPYYVLAIRTFVLGEGIKIRNNKNDEILAKLTDYYSELGDEKDENYKAEQKARKIARRKEKWRNIGLAFAQALTQVGSQYIAQNQYNNVQQLNSVGIGNLNSLLDPRLAMMQVSNQYYTEYNQFCQYNRKSDGSLYTFDEWLAMRAQAVNNMNTSGVSDKKQNENISSNSSSNMGRRCKKMSATDMAHCEGSGVCQRCNGDKRYWDSSFGVGHWVDPCTTCRGTGKCPSCGGTGHR